MALLISLLFSWCGCRQLTTQQICCSRWRNSLCPLSFHFLPYIHRLKTSLRPFSCSWYDCKPFSCSLEVMFCGLWRAFSPVLQMPSEQFVCFFKRWHMESDQCCGEKPDGTSQVEGRLRGSVLGSSICREPWLCKHNLAYAKMIALSNRIALRACTISCLIATLSVAWNSLALIPMKLLSDFPFKIIWDPWENECLVSVLHHSLLL